MDTEISLEFLTHCNYSNPVQSDPPCCCTLNPIMLKSPH
jgi:hypothetical protein